MADREGRTDRFGRPVTVQPPTTQNTMRLPSEDISSRLPNWITGSDWYQKEHARALERDQMNQGIPKEDRKFMLFEWIKSIIMNPNVSSTQASQILNDAGVMAKDLMMAMNPMGTAYAGQGQAQEMTAIPSYDPRPTPIVNPQHTGPEVADPGGPIAAGPNLDVTRPTIPDTESFAPRIPEPTTAMYGSNVSDALLGDMSVRTRSDPRFANLPNLGKERVAGEFYNMPSRSPMAFDDAKRRSSVPAPRTQSTGLLPPVGRTPSPVHSSARGGPGSSPSRGRSTRSTRRFGPH